MRYRYLTKDELISIHDQILKESDGTPGLLSLGNLNLCAESPQRVIYDFEPHTTLFEKAASLMYEINKLHPFLDGNKRTGFIAADTFLRSNGYRLIVDQTEAVKISIDISICSVEIEEISKWVGFKTRRGA